MKVTAGSDVCDYCGGTVSILGCFCSQASLRDHIDRFRAELEKAQKRQHMSDLNYDALEKRADQAESTLEQMTAKCADMIGALSFYATTRDCYVEKAEGVWLWAERVISDLPASVEKLLAIKRAAEEHYDEWNGREENEFEVERRLNHRTNCAVCRTVRANREIS